MNYMYVPETFAIFFIIHCTNTHLKYKALLSMKVIVLLFYIFTTEVSTQNSVRSINIGKILLR